MTGECSSPRGGLVRSERSANMLPPDQQHIVVGVDGSTSSLEAALWASVECVRTDSALCLVIANHDEAFRYYAARTVEEVAARCRTLRPELCVVTSVARGRPVECLVRESRNARELVLGGLGGNPLKSVSTAVAARAHCTVVLPNGTSGSRNGPVVVGLNGGHDDPLLQHALETATTREHPAVEVVRAWEEPAERDPRASPHAPHGWERLRQEMEGDLSDRLEPWGEKYPEVRIGGRVRAGHPVPVLTETSDGASLLVVGRRGGGSHTREGLGSTAAGVTRHANCPVAVVPSRASFEEEIG